MSDLVLTLNNGIKTVRDGEGGGGRGQACFFIAEDGDAPVGVSIIPLQNLLQPPPGSGLQNPESAFAFEAGGIRVLRTGWYLMWANGRAVNEGQQLTISVISSLEFFVGSSSIDVSANGRDSQLATPIIIQAGALLRIQATNGEGAPEPFEGITLGLLAAGT